jgi:hypothetical protein
MSPRVLAAIDTSAAAGPVLAIGRALARLYDVAIEAVHVREGNAEAAIQAAARAEVPLRILQGRTLDTLLSAGRGEDVVAVVVGARAALLGRQPAGHVALHLITSLQKPVIVVPPQARATVALERMLVPLEGTRAVAAALAPVIALAHAHGLDVVVLHVRDERSVPHFSEQPHHEMDAWTDEFLARHCAGVPGVSRLEVRVGSASEQIVRAAEESRVGLLALGWSQVLAPERAPVVKHCLAQSKVPMLLVPVEAAR